MGLLTGKVAAVTGAGRGIGRGEALALARTGAKVVVCDLGGSLLGVGQETNAADGVVEEINDSGGAAVACYSDISTEDGAQRLVWTAMNKFGRLDTLVNNAGIIRDRTLLNMSLEEWTAVLKVHLQGTFLCCQAAGRQFKVQGEGGSIINTTSVAGMIGAFGHPNYSSAKAGIFGFTRGTVQELGRFNVRINAICPHAFTRMTTVSKWMEDKEGVYSTDAIGQTVVYLASDLSRDVTGKVIGVQGGQSGSRISELKVVLSDGVELAPEEITAEKIAENFHKALSPLPDADIGRFLSPVTAKDQN
jgi:NAD(P)-dependent dehydrogenase (short-subunit alcohol dehydrogenase family)